MNERIRTLRKTLGLTLEKFGQHLGVSRAAMSNIENNNRKVTDQMCKSICREFDVNEKWLRYGTGEMFQTLAQNEIITGFTADLLKDNEHSFRRRFIEALAVLDADDWTVLEKIVDTLKKD